MSVDKILELITKTKDLPAATREFLLSRVLWWALAIVLFLGFTYDAATTEGLKTWALIGIIAVSCTYIAFQKAEDCCARIGNAMIAKAASTTITTTTPTTPTTPVP